MSKSLQRKIYELNLYEKILSNRDLAIKFSKLENKYKEQLLYLSKYLPEDEIINFKKKIYQQIQKIVMISD
ncbi:MAG: hypothetical protein ACP6IS_01195 [Candidatus Asgardarchaeia archaeon]